MFSYFSPFKQLLFKNTKKTDNTNLEQPKTKDIKQTYISNNKIFKDEEEEEEVKEEEDNNKENEEEVKEEEEEENEEQEVKVKEEEEVKDEEEREEDNEEEEEEEEEEEQEETLKLQSMFYLDKSTDINRDTEIDEYLKSENITKIKINIGIYQINTTNYQPFLTYLLKYENNNKFLSLPYFEYECTENSNNGIDKCKLHVLELFQILPDTKITKINDFFNKTLLYNGYFHSNQQNTDELFVIFEYKENKENKEKETPKTNLQHYWTTIHEIVNSKKRINIPIPIVYKWFLEFPELLYIKYIDDKSTEIRFCEIPYVLYSIEPSFSKNVEDIETNKKSLIIYQNSKKKQIIPSFFFHPLFGMKYFFSNNYIGNMENENITEEITRYAVFITKTFYILDEEIEIPEKEMKNISKYNSFYFQQNGEPIWVVTSVDYFTEIGYGI
jgi:hypothetical protein